MYTYVNKIQGIEEAVKAMKVGDRWKLQIPGPCIQTPANRQTHPRSNP